MAASTISTHGVMEGGGSYNLHARIPAGGANLSFHYLEDAARSLAVRPGTVPLVIADYGSSQGKTSLAPIRAAIQCLRMRIGAERPIAVVHVDQHANDFNTLFDVLHNDPERYSINDLSVFPPAIGRSFYENVFPPEQVDLGWCSYAAVWLSRYSGLRDFGKVHSSSIAVFALAGALGPLIMGAAFDRTGSYSAPLIGFLVATLLATVLMTRLGPYRFRSSEPNVASRVSHDNCTQELRTQSEEQ